MIWLFCIIRSYRSSNDVENKKAKLVENSGKIGRKYVENRLKIGKKCMT